MQIWITRKPVCVYFYDAKQLKKKIQFKDENKNLIEISRLGMNDMEEYSFDFGRVTQSSSIDSKFKKPKIQYNACNYPIYIGEYMQNMVDYNSILLKWDFNDRNESRFGITVSTHAHMDTKLQLITQCNSWPSSELIHRIPLFFRRRMVQN